MKRATIKRLFSDERGAVMTEYVVVTGVVGIVTLPALLYCGVALARNFVFVRDYALFPFP